MTEAQTRIAGVLAGWTDDQIDALAVREGLDRRSAAVVLNALLTRLGVLDVLTDALNAAGDPGAPPMRFRGAFIPRADA